MGNRKSDGRWNKTALNVLKLPARNTKGGVTLEMVHTGNNRWRDRNEIYRYELEQTPDMIVEPAQTIYDAGVRLRLGVGTNDGASRHHICSTAYLAARELTTEFLGRDNALDFEV